MVCKGLYPLPLVPRSLSPRKRVAGIHCCGPINGAIGGGALDRGLRRCSSTIWTMIHVRPMERGDRPWVVGRLQDAFGAATVARKASCSRLSTPRLCGRRIPLWLITNDNTSALRFY